MATGKSLCFSKEITQLHNPNRPLMPEVVCPFCVFSNFNELLCFNGHNSLTNAL